MGKATILGFSPNLAAMISSGGRISTMEGTAGQIWQKSLELGEEKNERLIGKVVSSGHTSVLEHGYVNLSFENVSVFAEQFLIEFRLASFTVKSRRYVDFSNCGWVTPFADAPAGLCAIARGEQVLLLAQYEGWAYVQTEIGETPVRAFLPVSAIE